MSIANTSTQQTCFANLLQNGFSTHVYSLISSEVSSISSCPSSLLFLLLPTCLVVLLWGPTYSLSFHFYSCKALGACDTCRDILAHTRPHHPDLPASSDLHIHTASQSHRIVSSAAPSPPEKLTPAVPDPVVPCVHHSGSPASCSWSWTSQKAPVPKLFVSCDMLAPIWTFCFPGSV